MAKSKRQKAARTSTRTRNTKKIAKPSIQEPNLTELLAIVRANPEDAGAVLALAEYYRRHNQDTKMADVLEPFAAKVSEFSETQRSIYYALLSYAYATTNRLLEAERTVETGLKEDSSSPDLWYILTYLKLHLKEYDRTIEAGEKLEEIFASTEENSLAGRYFAISDAHRSQSRNFIASAYRELKNISAAADWYDKSIKCDPANHLPYLNLATMYSSAGENSAALSWAQKGLKNCRQVQELRMLVQRLKQTATISACLIVKDEEKMLPGCLASIRDWVDEIIVVDTGSSDGTIAIAEEYGAKIYHKPWTGDFSAARNYSLEQATCDWVLIIDADERFVEEDISRTKQLIGDARNQILSINVFNVYGEKEDTTTFLPSIRLFRRKLDLRYEGIVHNRLELPPDVPVVRAPLRIKHHGYDLTPEQMQKKFLRSKALLEKQLAEDPDNVFALFNYAQLLRGEGSDFQRKNAPQILKAAGRAVELTDPKNIQHRHTHLMCLDQIAWTHFYLGNYDLALEFADRALKIKPEYLDPLMLRGHVLGKKRMYDEAVRAYKKYLDVQATFDPSAEVDNIILVNPDSRATAYYGLAMLAELRNDRASAIEYYRRTLDINPEYLEANGMLGRVCLSEGKPNDALKYFDAQLRITAENKTYLLEKARALEQLNRTDQAAGVYRELFAAHPNDPEVLVAHAEHCARSGREAELTDLIAKVLGAEPVQVGPLNQLAATCLRLGHYRLASSIYTALKERTELSADQLNDLANCYFKMGEFPEAETWYQRALQSPAPPNLIYRNLGLTQIRLGKTEDAAKSLKKYAEINPRDQAVTPVLGDLLARLGKHEEAVSFYEKSLMANPNDALALFGLSECYLNMGHRDSAVLGYQRVLQIDSAFEPARQRLSQLETVPSRA